VLPSAATAIPGTCFRMTLLRGVGLTKSYRHEVLTDVSFSLPAASTLGVIGESGSGKSTLARLVAGLETPDHGAVILEGHDITGIKRPRSERRRIQIIFQDPLAALNPALSIIASVEDFLVVHRMGNRQERRKRALAVLELVHLSERVARRRPGDLSGGQRQRACIARALVVEPQVLIADEPTSALDVSVQGQILNLLVELKRQRGLTLLLISHDIAVVRFAAEEMLVLHNGRVVDAGPAPIILASPSSPHTSDLIAAAEKTSIDF
jgi:peptide/nickel transport system ATP-binding protein